MTLLRYLSRLMLARFFTALLALAGIAGLLDIIDNAGTVIDRRGNAFDLLTYLGYRLPSILVSVFPLAVLVAAIFVFAGLALHQEIVALRAAGVTFQRILRSLVPAAALIGLVYWGLSNLAAPATELALYDWLGPTDAEKDNEPKSHWVRLGTAILSFETVSDRGAQLSNVTVYERTREGNLLRRLGAARATYLGHGAWRLDGLADSAATGRQTVYTDHMIWRAPLKPRDTLLAAIPPAQSGLVQPRRSAAFGWIGANSSAYYATRAQAALAIALIPFVMVCLALPVAAAGGRRSELASRLAIGLGAGLGYMLLDGILRTLGETGVLPALVAGWGATLLFMLAGASMILYIQD
jgi:lipopolysaccharide export system permease protein